MKVIGNVTEDPIWLEGENVLAFEYRDSFPDSPPQLQYATDPYLKLTDNIYFPGMNVGFLLSEKAKGIFEQFCMVPHRFYNASVLYKEKDMYLYFHMHIVSNLMELIDFKKSIFYEGNRFGKYIQDISLVSLIDYEIKINALREAHGYRRDIFAKKLCFSEPENFKFDLFYISKIDSNFYISEKLMKELKRSKITGFEFKEVTLFENI